MKFRFALIMMLAAILLAGCSLASDITPPPGYVPPTPMPTLGLLYPTAAPDIQDGAAIYSQNCAACHGNTGLGNGPQSQQLPVTVPALALLDTARSVSPAQWFTTVSQGNLQRFMPPWIGALSDQQRWDVVFYVLTLHAKPDQIAQGKSLFDAHCPDCASKFSDMKTMAALSEDDIVAIIKKGQGDIPAFGAKFTDEQALDVAIYIRTLTFAVTPPTATITATPAATAVPPTTSGSASSPATTATVAATASGSTPEATATAVMVSPTVTNAPGTGTVSGSIQMNNGTLPSNLTVTLHGFDQSQSQATPQETVTLKATPAPDGTFKFDNVAMADNRLFTAEVDYKDVQYQSTPATATAGTSNLTLSPVKLYDTTTDINALSLEQIHLDFDFATQGQAQVYEIYAFTNPGDKSVLISTDGATIPFIKLPAGAQNVNYMADTSSSPFVGAGKNGIAAPPSQKPYAIIASFTMPYQGQLEIQQPLAIDSPSMVLLLPQGMKASGVQLTDNGLQTIQNNSYETYSASNLKAGDTVDFTITGSPPASTTTPANNSPTWLFMAAGLLGLALIGIGAWFFVRDQRQASASDEEEDKFESADEVMDAILALDDLHRAGKIQDDIYRMRRAELKEILKGMM